MTPDTRVPIVLLTGFLGAGKTTLLNGLLRHPQMRGTAVVINEYGEVGLDQQLIAANGPEDMELIDGGCICCTVRGRLSKALLELWNRAEQKQLPSMKRMIIETTGLAEPGPILYELLNSDPLGQRFVLDATITLVDAANGESTLLQHPLAQRQVTAADRVLVTKTDLVPPAQAAVLIGRLRQLNPDAVVEAVPQSQARPEQLFCGASRDASNADYRPGAWLASADAIRYKPASEDRALRLRTDAPASIADIQTFSLILDEPLEPGRFFRWLDYLRATAGPDLLRIKGIVHIRGRAGPVVLHGVQNIFHPPQLLDAWPDQDRRTRVVFITRAYSAAAIERILDRLQEPVRA